MTPGTQLGTSLALTFRNARHWPSLVRSTRLVITVQASTFRRFACRQGTTWLSVTAFASNTYQDANAWYAVIGDLIGVSPAARLKGAGWLVSLLSSQGDEIMARRYMKPRRMQAKKAGTCYECGSEIRVGDVIYWARQTGAWHADCQTAQKRDSRKVQDKGKQVDPMGVDLAYEDSCARQCGM